MIASTLKWYGPQHALSWDDPTSKAILAAAWERVKAAATLLHTELQAVLNVQGTAAHPSRPGQPPHKVKGKLRQGVELSLDPKVMTAQIGLTLDARHGLLLEGGTKRMQPRPWAAVTVARLLPRLQALLGKGG